MADITWPTTEGVDFDPQAFDEALEFNVELTVARSGKVSTQSLPGARWRCVLQFKDAAMSRLVQRRRLFAFLASLRGGADRLLLWNLLTPEPLGSMRGTVTLAATVAAGASTAQITGGAARPNMLANSGFEIDSNADGLADGWITKSNGAVTGGTANGRPAGNGSPFAQSVYAAVLGPTTNDRFGLERVGFVGVTEGQTYTLAADVRGTVAAGATVWVYFDWYTAAFGFISGFRTSSTMATGWARRSTTLVAPPLAAFSTQFIFMEAGTTGGPVALEVDNVQFERSAVATPYAGLATLLRGDFLGFAGQRVMLTADATANDAGAVTVSFQPPHRAGAASAAAVTLVRPTTRYVLTQPVVQMPARGAALPGFAVEMVEE